MSPLIARIILWAWVMMMVSAVAVGAGDGRGHLDNPLLPEGCGSCHVGHGVSNAPMLMEDEEDFCYQCHGGEEKASQMRREGKLAAIAAPVNIEAVFDKPYRHPVEQVGRHRPDETLPADLTGETPSHAECVDCHSPHHRQLAAGRFGVSGFTAGGTRIDDADHEHEVCLKCHSDNTGLMQPEDDIRLLVGSTARSSHPIATPYDGGRSPSLVSQPAGWHTMRCSDCHGNDDANGPAGPHASNYPALLKSRYETAGETYESGFEFALCYSCHSRTSILSNESFPLHREHISGDPGRRIPGTSCATCHDPHGSLRHEHLIKFNREVVSADVSGRVQFVDLGERRGECYLLCHNKNHSPARY